MEDKNEWHFGNFVGKVSVASNDGTREGVEFFLSGRVSLRMVEVREKSPRPVLAKFN